MPQLNISLVDNLGKVILECATQYQDRTAIRTEGDFVTYAHLRALIINYALHMRQHGVNRSSCVSIDTQNPIIAIVLTIACSLLGCSWVQESAASLANPALGVTHRIHDGTRHQLERKGILRVTQLWSDPPVRAQERGQQGFLGYASPDKTWMIAQSSGTTGVSKPMAVSQAMTWRRIATDLQFPTPEWPVFAPLFPPMSISGIYYIMRNLIAGGVCVFSYKLQFLRDNQVHYAWGGANHFIDLLHGASVSDSKIPYALTGGSPTRSAFMRELLRYFEHVQIRYGATETGSVCNKIFSHTEGMHETPSVGAAQSPAIVQIVTEDDIALPSMREGIVRVRSPMSVSGYIGDPITSGNVFRDGWFYPGDLGYLSESGELQITGRVGDQLNIGGIKLNPDLVDNLIQSSPGLRDGACFALPSEIGIDRLVAAVVIVEATDPVHALRGLEKMIWDRLGPSWTPSEFYIVDTMPKNTNGKIVRRALVEAVHGKRPIDLGPA